MDNYFRASNNAFSVGVYAGEFLIRLMEATGVPHEDIHLIGYSLGAHGVGHLGRTVAAATGKKLRRLTALEPAQPYVNMLDPALWVNKEDAELVDVLHTNSDHLISVKSSFSNILEMPYCKHPNIGRHFHVRSSWTH